MAEDDFAKIMATYTKKPDNKRPTEAEKSARAINDSVKTRSRPVDDLPIAERAIIDQHTKTVSAVAFDKTGSRMVTGGYDYNIGYYDFGGMDRAMQPFRYVQPIGAYKIRALRFSACSQWLLVASSSAKAALLDREGKKIREYAEGDLYLRDMRNTDGHVGALSTAWWNPVSPDHFLTAGQDGTVRIWNIGYRKKQDHVLVVKSRRPGGRAPVSAARYNADARTIVTGGEDGAIRLWSGTGPWTSPQAEVIDAHQPGAEITSLAYDGSHGNWLVSRATDDTVKLWDTRSLKHPVAIASGLVNFVSETVAMFSPDSNYIVTGTSAKKDSGEKGSLVFLDATDLSIRESIEMGGYSVVGLDWNAGINQIAVGLGDGTAAVLYDQALSKKGALLAAGKASLRPEQTTEPIPAGRILTPHAIFRDASTENRTKARLKARKDPVQSHRPDLPVLGPGKGGRIGSSATQAIMAERLPAKSTRDEDPREALLKYAQKAAEEPLFIAPAYRETQPKPVLDASLLEKEAREEARKAQERLKAEQLHLHKKQ